METLYREIELPLVFVLDDMEKIGVRADGEALKAYGQELVGQIEKLEQSIYEKAGEAFNINSPKQLGAILFEKLKMPNGKKTKTGFSTAADVLEKLGAGLSHRVGDPGIPAADQAEIHLCGRTGALHRRGRQDPYHLPPDHHGHRAFKQHRAESAEYPGAAIRISIDPQGLYPQGGRSFYRRGLFPDRTAGAGPYVRG